MAAHAVAINVFKAASGRHHTSELKEFRIVSSKMSFEDAERMFLCHPVSLAGEAMSDKSPGGKFV